MAAQHTILAQKCASFVMDFMKMDGEGHAIVPPCFFPHKVLRSVRQSTTRCKEQDLKMCGAKT